MTAAEIEVEKPALREEHANAHDMAMTPSVIIRQVLSLALCIFSVTIVVALIFTGNTRVANDTNPWIALIVCVSVLFSQLVWVASKFIIISVCFLTFIIYIYCLQLHQTIPTHIITQYQQYRPLPLLGCP